MNMPGSWIICVVLMGLWAALAFAMDAGETEIMMKYVRPWEKEAPPLRTHVFKVKIQ